MKNLFPICFLFVSLTSHAEPFWAEKGSWHQGDLFYSVGVASKGDSAQKRQDSLKNALREASQSLGYEVDSAETQRLFEGKDKTFRLIVVNPKPTITQELPNFYPTIIQEFPNEKRVYFYPANQVVTYEK